MKRNHFDLEAALAGAPVCTRDGKKARIICFDRMNRNYPIIALIQVGEGKDAEEVLQSYTRDGLSHMNQEPSELDLVIG